ncbi:MAG: hypothetical protein WC464_05425 [Bdellovibrionales bacterium]
MFGLLEELRSRDEEKLVSIRDLIEGEKYIKNLFSLDEKGFGPRLTNESISRIVYTHASVSYVEIFDSEKNIIQVAPPDRNYYCSRDFYARDWSKDYFRLTAAGRFLAKALPPLPIKDKAVDWDAAINMVQNPIERTEIFRKAKEARNWNLNFWMGFEITLQLLPRIISPVDSNLFWMQRMYNAQNMDNYKGYRALEEYELVGFISAPPHEQERLVNITGIKVTPAGFAFAQAITKAEEMVREIKKQARPKKLLPRLPLFGRQL